MSLLGDLIAREALNALADPTVDGSRGMCQHFVRVVCERVGGRAEQLMDAYRRETALLTMQAFAGSSYDIWRASSIQPPQPQPGDILYKGNRNSGPDGHAAIVYHQPILGKAVLCVAENSNYQILHPEHAIQGAKGWRALHEFGPYDMIVRLS